MNTALSTQIDELRNTIKTMKSEKTQTGIDGSSKDKDIIDIEYENAMARWSGSTAEGVDIIISFGDKWKEEMNKYYSLLHEKLTDDKKDYLVSSQEKWEQFSKNDEELTWQTYDQLNHGGSIMRIYSSEIYLERYRSRALKLKELCEFLTAVR